MKIDPADRPKVKVECLRMIANLKLDGARHCTRSGVRRKRISNQTIDRQIHEMQINRQGEQSHKLLTHL